MVRNTIILLILVTLTSPILGEIRVKIQNVPETTGWFMIAVFPEDGYLNREKAVAKKRVPAREGAIILFENLRPGKYAISLFQDKNGNGILDKSYIGYPQEPIGFSRVSQIGTSAPPFSMTSFDYTGKLLELNIQMIHP